MSTFPTNSATGFAALAARIGRTVWQTLVRWHRRRRNRLAVKQLLTWNDYMLRDIGLTRDDVRCALRDHRKIETSGRLRILAVERRATARAHARSALEVATSDGHRKSRFASDRAASCCDA
ncbi:DUF1127 domain-containing protein [Breoghania sp.]|uniref:DUF1127 domain-containing protein n=1 Tax=Breoghania sp. TaxID=2065378 RepID=UPI0026182297|nr:DUF1127 domain-containing protein [Breoghania sp.]MDJ0930130.1 DUF1127 domain-containing protein [Breoghania sp.]